MNFPEDLKYTKEHEWVRVEGDIAIVGITEHAQSELGDIVYVEVETVDESLAQEEVFGAVEAIKTTADLFLIPSIYLKSFIRWGAILSQRNLTGIPVKSSNILLTFSTYAARQPNSLAK